MLVCGATMVAQARYPVSNPASKEFVFTGQDYLFNFVLPNLFFHATATYLILRHNGVELGKMDFLGA